MQKMLVRCYRAKALGADDESQEVVFALPDFGDAPRLYSCVACGALFGALPEKEHHSAASGSSHLAGLSCPECAASLSVGLQPYPQTFRTADGTLSHFEPARDYPPDSESITKEVWDIYS